MEAVDELPVFNSTIDNLKTTVLEENVVEETSACHKSNGLNTIVETEPLEVTVVTETLAVENECGELDESNGLSKMTTNDINSEVNCTGDESVAAELKSDDNVELHCADDNVIPAPEAVIDGSAKITVEITEICQEDVVDSESGIIASNVDSIADNVGVKFKTEILVENNDNDIKQNVIPDSHEPDSTHNILSDLGHNIELSEVLRSSDVSEENIEHNSNSVRQEVFNKEELLDILEGKDVDSSINENSGKHSQTKMLEAQIAMKQLSRLQSAKKKKNSLHVRAKKGEKKEIVGEEIKIVSETNIKDAEKLQQEVKQTETENIVHVLVMDWQDDEPTEIKADEKVLEPSENLVKDSEEIEVVQEQIIGQDELVNQTSLECTGSEEIQHNSKGNDDDPPRRVGRVIKKKVIFDPDNPDTFTKTKTPSKSRDNLELVSIKKIKPEHAEHRSKSKSPLSKLQWKKPSPKNNSKQHKRLSEVDKLLMDEGAVNMIYQLTPEAPKGKKNMKTKAEFIKKIQSSTPDGKEMKFRERKKESLKYEEGEAKRILGGKHRGSLCSSVKSPSVSEDFETHSADDSIIYRRHSSSSYSSSCMSPRRLSDVETGTGLSNTHSIHQPTDNQVIPKSSTRTDKQDQQITNVFMAENQANNSSSEIINKHDCMSIKEKLNSKLSLALKKRKRENSKTDKPVKQKRVSKVDEISQTSESNQFKFISINIEQRLALICIKKTGLKVCIEVLKELEEALIEVDSRQDISVTLLTSQCGTLCSSLDLTFLLDEDEDARAAQAYALAESVRSLLCSMVQHSKLICCGMWGACSGVALALTALSDIVLASECATFALCTGSLPMLPGAATLSSCRRGLPQAMVNDLVIFGRRLSASEALQNGLISRTLWPDRFDEQVNNIARDIAAQPPQTILLKKKLLNLERKNELNTVLSCLEAERDLLVEYWTSVEGQELLRVTLDAA